jgi:GNAT superfamily N-acetyltransferase
MEETYTLIMRDGEGEIIAELKLARRNLVWWLASLWVKPDVRQKGYATQLLDRAVYVMGQHDLYLHAQPFTDQPVPLGQLARWYNRWGFRPTAVPDILRREATVCDS